MLVLCYYVFSINDILHISSEFPVASNSLLPAPWGRAHGLTGLTDRLPVHLVSTEHRHRGRWCQQQVEGCSKSAKDSKVRIREVHCAWGRQAVPAGGLFPSLYAVVAAQQRTVIVHSGGNMAAVQTASSKRVFASMHGKHVLDAHLMLGIAVALGT